MEWPIKKFAEHHIKDGGLDSFVCSTIYYLVPHVTMAGNLLTQNGWKHSLLKLSPFSCRLQKCFLPNVRRVGTGVAELFALSAFPIFR